MDEKTLIQNMEYLVDKYLNNRGDLIELINQDKDSVKYILSELDKGKKKEYDESDRELLKDIAFFYL